MTLLTEQPMVLITGIPAAGKSTVANLLTRRFERGVHVKGDIYRRMVVAGRHEMTSTPSEEAWRQLRLRYRLAAVTADAYHQAGFSVVIQDVVIGPVLAEYIAAIHSRPLVAVVLTPRPDVVVQREADRRKVAYRDGFARVSDLDLALRRETPRIGMWLDSSDQQPDATVNEIIERGLDAGRIE
ncbi:MAG: AAA family ATPase [Acidimicrobiales bacterium]